MFLLLLVPFIISAVFGYWMYSDPRDRPTKAEWPRTEDVVFFDVMCIALAFWSFIIFTETWVGAVGFLAAGVFRLVYIPAVERLCY